MKILVTGGSGFVGRNIVRFFAARHDVSFTYFQHVPRTDCGPTVRSFYMDVRLADDVKSAVGKAAPEAVIHIAGNKNVKFCETYPEEAFAINAIGVQNVAQAAHNAGAQMVYLSTDLVFECSTGGYTEFDKPQPSSVYGNTKFEGERFALTEARDVAVCRSGGIFGLDSPLLRWVTEEVRSGREVTCLTNVRNSPTFVDNLAEMIEVILKRRLNGIFHTVGRTAANRYEFFTAFAKAFHLDAKLLQSVESETLMRELFLRPNAALDGTWTNRVIGVKSMSLGEGMRALKTRSEELIEAVTS